MKMDQWVTIRTAGEHPHGSLDVNVTSRTSCGEIQDGLCVYWTNDARAPTPIALRGTPRTPGFVISYDDLERVYFAARRAREPESIVASDVAEPDRLLSQDSLQAIADWVKKQPLVLRERIAEGIVRGDWKKHAYPVDTQRER